MGPCLYSECYNLTFAGSLANPNECHSEHMFSTCFGIVNDLLPAGYHVEVSDEGSPIKSATSTDGASHSQLNSPTLLKGGGEEGMRF